MFGYIIVNKSEMKYKDFDLYQSYYCGFCRRLREKYGFKGELTLTYDMTFLILLLGSLYETEDELGMTRCLAHPLEKHPTRKNEYTEYAADMNIILTYYNCMDDWEDEHKLFKRIYAAALKKSCRRAEEAYPEKAAVIKKELASIQECEKAGEEDLDRIAGHFGNLMAEIFVYRHDEWEDELRTMGFFLGKFIYLMDAYEDVKKDQKTGNYNPFIKVSGEKDFDDTVHRILQMMIAECCRAFEMLPIVNNVDILRNILYSGVWSRYEVVRGQRKELETNA